MFLGTSEFAADVLERLAGSASDPARHRPELVITRPDRPAGRGRKLSSPPVAQRALALGLELAQPQSVNDPAACELIARTKAEIVVVCAFGALIKEPLLSEYEMLNVHPSLLPRWRGAAPIERALMEGDTDSGVSIMRLTAGLDSGPVCLSACESIAAEDTYGSLAPRLSRVGGELLVSALDAIERGEPPVFVEQDENQVTYAEKIGPADRLLDPAQAASELERVVRALHPHIGARVALSDGTLLGVHSAAIFERSDLLDTAVGADEPRSRGIFVKEGHLLLGCAAGTLELLVVQPPGGKPMEAGAFLRGRHDLPGETRDG